MSAQPPGRIPFEDIASAKSWLLPEVNGKVINGDEQRKRKTQAGKNKAQQNKRSAPESPVVSEDVDPPEPEQVKGVTAQQLEEITQAAEQDGFDKGYAEGLEQGKLDGRKAGYSEGIKAGTEQAESEHGQWLKEQGQHLQQLCEALFSPLEHQQQALADTTLDLALGLAKHILQQELQLDSRKIIAVVDRALEALPPVEKNIALYLHPDDANAYRDYAPQPIAADVIHEDASLTRGSCSVKSEHSYIDYSVAARLDEFVAALADKPFDSSAATSEVPSFEREPVSQPISQPKEPQAAIAAEVPQQAQAEASTLSPQPENKGAEGEGGDDGRDDWRDGEGPEVNKKEGVTGGGSDTEAQEELLKAPLEKQADQAQGPVRPESQAPAGEGRAVDD
ncbi:flagellar assembly protein FliH [Marinagarivorans cellulosilyticus]|uniref:Flagellar assembly protein FliH n=1 Tax=Marinagarivorans cellulosilyticus TaxID=2721545 RepID=A0AAN2BLP1_9GAMM|nr:flagellar assembly protein FliH [Marinagarivorans cellulosilyticus]BCD99242.1 flagellar assembly protein FliH [Marinagarivorans cellulosilyticus]